MKKEIEGYNGNYLIYDDGRVFSVNTGKFMRLNKHYKTGYLSVSLSKNDVKKRLSVHRLVALHFIPNSCNLKNEINHINGIKTDNRIENLEWCTRSENCIHSIKNGLKKPVNKNNFNIKYYNSKNVVFIKDTIVIDFISQKECARYFNVTKSYVQRSLKNKSYFKGGILI